MQKQDYPPLLQPGKHVLTLEQLQALAVTAFSANPGRIELFSRFAAWLEKVRGHGVGAILWIDGSFLTEKDSPGDIDCVMWNPMESAPLTGSQKLELSRLVNRTAVKILYGLDFYLERTSPDQAFHREAYWMGVFGFQHDRKTAKGFVELKV